MPQRRKGAASERRGSPAADGAAAPAGGKRSGRPAAAAGPDFDSILSAPPPCLLPGGAGRAVRVVVALLVSLACLRLVAGATFRAYDIRLYAVKEYGRVIHEFDPWFNFRATEYLSRNGWTKFFHWFDHESWYPLGRPVGTTIYPGMQITAVAIHEAMKALPPFKFPKWLFKDTPFVTHVPVELRILRGEGLESPMSLNDVCVFMPAWFGPLASIFLGLLTYEATRSRVAGAVATALMAIIPAHIMRSVAGGFDNESIAVTAICLTFWLWVRALRTPKSWPIGAIAGLAYIYMVAAWGGYIFVINMVGAHAALMVVLGHYSTSLYRAYTLFFVIGTAGATCVPCVAWLPLKSMEQLAPLLVFVVFQVLEACDVYRRRQKSMSATQFFMFRAGVFAAAALGFAVVWGIMFQMGLVSPMTSRIRALFIKHRKTGNPLVDSVAEHQAANPEAFDQYLHLALPLAKAGFGLCFLRRTPGAYFLILYAYVAQHFSLKMSRLILICGPVAAALAGAAVGYIFDWCVEQLLSVVRPPAVAPGDTVREPARTGGMGTIFKSAGDAAKVVVGWNKLRFTVAEALTLYRTNKSAVGARAAVALVVLTWAVAVGPKNIRQFQAHSDQVARSMSHPQLMFKTRDGRLIDDYRQSYLWVKENTPQDARVMAWWDYGYQIAGIANRTSIADGNTWNHEHIATLGMMLTSPEKKAHKMIRHLADYVLVWAGESGDDLGKSPHLARIGNSVYPDHCGDADPTCNKFGFYSQGHGDPTPMMKESLLYKMHSSNLRPGISLDPKLFKEVHSTQYGLVRVYKVMDVSKESKEWVANPANRLCDAPGSWYCPGQYPPKFREFMTNKRDFSQLEDFNKQGKGKESAYTRLVRERQRKGQAEGV